MSEQDTQAVIDLAVASTTPHKVTAGGLYVIEREEGAQLLDLTGDQFRDNPRHKTGVVQVRDVASLTRYYDKHSSADSEIFADLDAATVTAVLDAHGAEADWQRHRVTLGMVKTPEWITWTGANKRPMTQQQFAEFIEDNAADIAPAGPCTAADLMEMAQQFQAHTKVEFKSGKRLASGQTQLLYSETIDAKAGERGTIEIPDAFELALMPFEDCEPYRVKARFRYRIREGDLSMFYALDAPERVYRDAILYVVVKAEQVLDTVIMRGKPAPQ